MRSLCLHIVRKVRIIVKRSVICDIGTAILHLKGGFGLGSSLRFGNHKIRRFAE